MKQVSIIGLGLIGGSFARDFKNLYPEAVLVGIDQNESHLKEALSLGLIDVVGSIEVDLSKADLVFIAIPVDATIALLPSILDLVPENCVVTDAGSTKASLCEAVAKHPKRRNYLAAHPIAGTEFSGPSAAVAGLFKGKTNIICEVEQTAFKLQEQALEIFNAMGMRIRYMNAAAHDTHIAYMSHLSHISSFMLGKTVIEKEKNERDIFDMAGSGFESTVRLAKSSPAMWAPIFKDNKAAVLESLTDYIANLTAFKALMEVGDFEGVYKQMEETNKIKAILNGLP
ncbi:MAG: prephenate dehydrogenase [Flavobacteriaceae bacterium]|mgnify:CR=1 FL=1|tara:strand:- start:8940 stop:9794 length:855 start_codon:yes stop_codon:yes gene_type:complete